MPEPLVGMRDGWPQVLRVVLPRISLPCCCTWARLEHWMLGIGSRDAGRPCLRQPGTKGYRPSLTGRARSPATAPANGRIVRGSALSGAETSSTAALCPSSTREVFVRPSAAMIPSAASPSTAVVSATVNGPVIPRDEPSAILPAQVPRAGPVPTGGTTVPAIPSKNMRMKVAVACGLRAAGV